MDDKIKGVMTIAVLLSLLAGGATSDYFSDTVYYCESTENSCVGTLSSTSKTCYYIDEEGDNRGKRCSSLWKEWDFTTPKNIIGEDVKEETVIISVIVEANGKLFTCETINGIIKKYTNCHSGSSKGYLGELI